MRTSDTHVPLATRRRSGGSIVRGLLQRAGDRVMRLTEDVLGEDLDERVSKIELHPNELGFDVFGFDPGTGRYALAVTALLHRLYFRSRVVGIENVPRGRVLIVANHSGQLPIDGLLLGTALMLDAEPPRVARSMVERWSAELPFVSVFFARCGQVVGSPENARRLLDSDECLVVFPEGVRGIAKTYAHRYELVDFGLGFMRLALETGTPIVPVAIVGGEEQYISVADVKPLAKFLGLPAFPIIPQLFVGGVLPLPTRYHIHFGEPLRFDGDPDDDDVVIEEKVWVVRSTIQSMLHRALEQRTSIFF